MKNTKFRTWLGAVVVAGLAVATVAGAVNAATTLSLDIDSEGDIIVDGEVYLGDYGGGYMFSTNPGSGVTSIDGFDIDIDVANDITLNADNDINIGDNGDSSYAIEIYDGEGRTIYMKADHIILDTTPMLDTTMVYGGFEVYPDGPGPFDPPFEVTSGEGSQVRADAGYVRLESANDIDLYAMDEIIMETASPATIRSRGSFQSELRDLGEEFNIGLYDGDMMVESFFDVYYDDEELDDWWVDVDTNFSVELEDGGFFDVFYGEGDSWLGASVYGVDLYGLSHVSLGGSDIYLGYDGVSDIYIGHDGDDSIYIDTDNTSGMLDTIGTWHEEGVPDNATSFTSIGISGGGSDDLYVIAPYDGSIIATTVHTNNTAPGLLRVVPSVNGFSTSPEVQVTAGNQDNYANDSAGNNNFNAGDRIGVQVITGDHGWDTEDIIVNVVVEYDAWGDPPMEP